MTFRIFASRLITLLLLFANAALSMGQLNDQSIVVIDGFRGHRSGPLMPEVGPTPEYHFVDATISPGPWIVTSYDGDPQAQAGWRVFRDQDGEGIRLQAKTKAKHWRPTIATGDRFWKDYGIRFSMRRLSDTARRYGAGVRCENDRVYLFVGIDRDKASIIEVRHEVAFREPGERVLASAPFDDSGDQILEVEIRLNGSSLDATIAGVHLHADAGDNPEGGVSLQSDGPIEFRDVQVTCTQEESNRVAAARQATALETKAIADSLPQPQLWKRIPTPDFGCDRNYRFGDLDGDGKKEIVIGQIQHHGPRDANSELSCLTAINLDGDILWQIGSPDRYRYHLTNDVGFQVHDFDGDGGCEVIYCKDMQVHLADGRTGETIRSADLPLNPNRKAPANLFPRILGDSLALADLSGKGRATDILIKDRYGHAWAWNQELKQLWMAECNTGHYPVPLDIDGDGRDEVFLGYSLLDSDGTTIWSRDDQFQDHADAIAVVDLNRNGRRDVLWAGSDEGLIWLNEEGIPRKHLRFGHTQNLTIADLRPELPGLEVAVINFWKNQGILHVLDSQGNVLLSREPRGDHGSALPPVNWDGGESELLFLNPDPDFGGLLDGHGRFVVRLPRDGHPVRSYDAIDLVGDARDELIVWDSREIWIYTQSTKSQAPDSIRPRQRNPRYNESNYRSRISIPTPVEAASNGP